MHIYIVFNQSVNVMMQTELNASYCVCCITDEADRVIVISINYCNGQGRLIFVSLDIASYDSSCHRSLVMSTVK